jgi:redox-sensing transcriptional repressor
MEVNHDSATAIPEGADENRALSNRNCVLRLLHYKSALHRLKSMGFIRIFSDNLADAVGVTSSRVRKDFSLFGVSGNKKGGYLVHDLVRQLECILGADDVHRVVVLGVGKIGRALIEYRGFARERVEVVAGFDIDCTKLDPHAAVPILPLAELSKFVQANAVRIAVIAVPEVAAQQAFQMAVSAGIEGILNFAPVRLGGHGDTIVTNVDLAHELENLVYFVNLRSRLAPQAAQKADADQ